MTVKTQNVLIETQKMNRETQKIILINLSKSALFTLEILKDSIQAPVFHQSVDDITACINTHDGPIVIHTQTNNQVWMPKELIDEKNVANLLNYVTPESAEEAFAFEVPQFNLISLFIPIEKDFVNTVTTQNKQVVIIDQLSGFLGQISKDNAAFYLHFDVKGVIAIHIEKEAVKFAKHFVCNNKQELQYFLNLIFKQLHLQIIKPKIYLSGKNEHFDSVYDTLSKHYSIQMFFDNQNSENIEVQYVSNLYKCVLSGED